MECVPFDIEQFRRGAVSSVGDDDDGAHGDYAAYAADDGGRNTDGMMMVINVAAMAMLGWRSWDLENSWGRQRSRSFLTFRTSAAAPLSGPWLASAKYSQGYFCSRAFILDCNPASTMRISSKDNRLPGNISCIC
jgi:hypothetical protein